MEKERFCFVNGQSVPIGIGETCADIAKRCLSKGLNIVVVTVDGKMVDLDFKPIGKERLLFFDLSHAEVLPVLRHSCAHLLAAAVKNIRPDALLLTGPATENGFHYDFVTDTPFSEHDLLILENKMQELIEDNDPFIRKEMSRKEAIEFLKSKGEIHKIDIVNSLPEESIISFYEQGGFVDLCAGPHVPDVSYLKFFKLFKVSEVFGRGGIKAQRISGSTWRSEKEMKNTLVAMEEAAARDHRKLGVIMHLFHFQEEAAGQVFWHNKGWTLYRLIESHIRSKLLSTGYEEVHTPIIADRSLWERSGHWDKFRENMFCSESEDRIFALKPMNCPCHVQIFNRRGAISYRDLPIRMAEFGSCHRNEPSGSLHGLMRVRGFTQDDAHIFCSEDQIKSEVLRFCDLLRDLYTDFGFSEFSVKFSDRPENRAGSDEIWDKAERSLLEALQDLNINWTENKGEGAFYGPKLEFVLKDCIGRDWQCGTVQVDFVLPERLDAFYFNDAGDKVRPVMIHRAVIGTFERFIGVLLEHVAGRLPLWLSPVQIAVLTISPSFEEYADEVVSKLKNNGFRVEKEYGSEKITKKIRKRSEEKIPILCIVGKQEQDDKTVSVRRLGSKDVYSSSLNDFISSLTNEVNSKK